MIIESGNPVHSLAESDKFRAAMRAAELTVVIDVVHTETTEQADWILPASSQYEKAEATFFGANFPANTFHLRQAILEPLQPHKPLLTVISVILKKILPAEILP